jgi:hypothetical protein
VSVKDGPGEGTWSGFATRVVEERDQLRAECESLKAKLALLAQMHDLGDQTIQPSEIAKWEYQNQWRPPLTRSHRGLQWLSAGEYLAQEVGLIASTKRELQAAQRLLVETRESWRQLVNCTDGLLPYSGYQYYQQVKKVRHLRRQARAQHRVAYKAYVEAVKAPVRRKEAERRRRWAERAAVDTTLVQSDPLLEGYVRQMLQTSEELSLPTTSFLEEGLTYCEEFREKNEKEIERAFRVEVINKDVGAAARRQMLRAVGRDLWRMKSGTGGQLEILHHFRGLRRSAVRILGVRIEV